MDEYVGGITSNYMTNGNMLKKRTLELVRLASRGLREGWSGRLPSA